MCAVQVLYFEWRHVRPKDDLTLPFTDVGIDIYIHIDNNNSISISSTLYYGAECSVAGHVSWRRSPHVTVMSAQPSQQAVLCTCHLAARGRMLCSTGRSTVCSTVYTAHCTGVTSPTPYLQYKYQFSTLVGWPRLG